VSEATPFDHMEKTPDAGGGLDDDVFAAMSDSFGGDDTGAGGGVDGAQSSSGDHVEGDVWVHGDGDGQVDDQAIEQPWMDDQQDGHAQLWASHPDESQEVMAGDERGLITEEVEGSAFGDDEWMDATDQHTNTDSTDSDNEEQEWIDADQTPIQPATPLLPAPERYPHAGHALEQTVSSCVIPFLSGVALSERLGGHLLSPHDADVMMQELRNRRERRARRDDVGDTPDAVESASNTPSDAEVGDTPDVWAFWSTIENATTPWLGDAYDADSRVDACYEEIRHSTSTSDLAMHLLDPSQRPLTYKPAKWTPRNRIQAQVDQDGEEVGGVGGGVGLPSGV